MVHVRAMRTLENAVRRCGFYRVAGCDEVGRGCLAGPVVAGAVILDPGSPHPGLADSKMMTALERERLYDVITRKALAWSVASAPPGRDRHASTSIAPRSRRCGGPSWRWRRCPTSCWSMPSAFPDLLMAQRGRAARRSHGAAPIAAASIVAKVTRDREMLVHHDADPRYGYDRHKGYATADHLAAVARHGYSPLHRRSFSPPSLFDTIE